MCYNFIRLAAQWVCLHHHHYEHMSNTLSYDVTMAIRLLGDSNFSAPV